MSAFYDIWIGKNRPEYRRLHNNDWQQDESAWRSLPEKDNGFLKTEQSGNYKLIIIGQLYESITVQEVLQRCINYIEDGAKGFEDPAGHYILFVQNELMKHTHVFTNRLGSYHAYWSTDNAISTYYLGLAKSKKNKQLNWEGITGFMAMGYFPNDLTYLQGIHIFEPASYYFFDESLSLEQKKRYWQWQYQPNERKPEEYTAQLQSILYNSLSTSVENKRVAIPISGGLDSRLLAGELTSSIPYQALSGFSYGFTENSPETKIAEQIATQRNIPLHSYVMPNYLFEEIDNIREAVELFQYIDGTRQASATNWLTDNADVVVGGHWGDVWMDNMHVENDEELQDAFQKKIIKRGSAWLLENVCQPNVNNTDEYLNDYFSSFMNQLTDIMDADFKMKIYKSDQWSFRWTTASLRMYQAGTMPVLPFYDKRIVDLFCTVPTAVVQNRELEIAYLKQYHEDLAKITWQEYDADLYNYKYFNNRNLAYRAVKKLQRTLSSEKTIQRNWEVFYLNPEGKRKLENYLLNNKLLNNIVSEDKIKVLLDDLQNKPTAANGYSVSMLLTFSLFLNKVFD